MFDKCTLSPCLFYYFLFRVGVYLFIAILQTSCATCGGDDVVMYEWTFESNSDNPSIELFDWDSYAVIDGYDASLAVDSTAFSAILEVEVYAFVLRGTCSLRRIVTLTYLTKT